MTEDLCLVCVIAIAEVRLRALLSYSPFDVSYIARHSVTLSLYHSKVSLGLFPRHRTFLPLIFFFWQTYFPKAQCLDLDLHSTSPHSSSRTFRKDSKRLFVTVERLKPRTRHRRRCEIRKTWSTRISARYCSNNMHRVTGLPSTYIHIWSWRAADPLDIVVKNRRKALVEGLLIH